MKKNGFTLVELLGVVTILAMLGMIVVPTINKVISDNKRELYEIQISNIKSGTSDFVSENIFSDRLEIPNNSSIGIKLGKLKELGYVDSDISDPITKNKFSDDMVVMITNRNNVFSYTVCDGSVNCSYTSIWE